MEEKRVSLFEASRGVAAFDMTPDNLLPLSIVDKDSRLWYLLPCTGKASACLVPMDRDLRDLQTNH